MLLALDVGNSNTSIGFFKPAAEGEPSALIADWRITTPYKQTTDEIASQLHLADSVVRAELLRLADAGLLHSLPSVQKERFYEMVIDPFWDYCREEVARFGNQPVRGAEHQA